MITPLSDPGTIGDVLYDVIGTNYDLVDPQRFLYDYLTRRKNDSHLKGRVVMPPVPEHSAYGAHLKFTSGGSGSGSKGDPGAFAANAATDSQSDKGFVAVVNKKKQQRTKKTAGDRATGAAVGVGGRTVPGAN